MSDPEPTITFYLDDVVKYWVHDNDPMRATVKNRELKDGTPITFTYRGGLNNKTVIGLKGWISMPGTPRDESKGMYAEHETP